MGYGGGKKGRKRYLLLGGYGGLVLKGEIHSATVPDQGGIKLSLEAARERLAPLGWFSHPILILFLADS